MIKKILILTCFSLHKSKITFNPFLGLILAPFLFIASCNINEPHSTQSQQEAIILDFDELDLKYKEMTVDEILQDINNISQLKIDNKLKFEQWVISKINLLITKEKQPSTAELRNLLSNLFGNDNLGAAEHLAVKIFKDYNQPNFYELHGRAAAILAHKFNFLGATDSVEFYNNILESAIKLDTTQWLEVSYYSNLGNIASAKGQKFEALVNYRQALKLVGENHSGNYESLTLNIAIIYLELNFYNKALEYLKKAIDKQENINELSNTFLNTYAITLQKLNFFNESKAIYEAILRKLESNPSSGTKAMVYSNLGNLHRKKKDYKSAMRYFDLSDSICNALNIEIGILINQINRSELFIEKGDFKSALLKLQKAEKDVQNFRQPDIKKEFHRLMYIAQDSIGNKDLANHHFRLFTINKELFFGDLTRSAITEQELLFERQKNFEKTAAMRIELEKEVKEKYFIAFLLTLSVFVLSVIIAALFKRNIDSKKKAENEKKKLKEKLEKNSKKLLSETLVKINEENLKASILSELNTVLKDIPTTEKQKFLKLKYKLRSKLKDSTIAEFETRFNGVYEEFYSNLLKIAPNLTSNELKVCALIKLNISTKDIAELTNRTQGTIENVRVEIRKKLQLQKTSNLQEFLRKI